MTKLEIRNSKLANQIGAGEVVRDFMDLEVWKLARQLRRAVYAVTRTLPAEEKYVLVSQMRRAAVSITANVAEGFGRYSYQENVQFCRQARGSAAELRDHFTTCLDESYVTEAKWKELEALTQRVTQLINGYIRATVARQAKSNMK